MKQFRVKYAAVSHSRYGSYIYNNVETVKAENKDEAVAKVRATVKQNHSQWKFRLLGVSEA